MRRLSSFLHVTLDGYFAGPDGDFSWAHRHDAEFNAFVAENARSGGLLLFGRRTYELMERYWPTPQALEGDPIVAERMNALPKVVFSRTLAKASWSNTTLARGDPAAEVRRMKGEPGPDMAILGSGSIVSQLAQEGLIDSIQLVVNPVALGAGKAVFAGIEKRLALRRTGTRIFANGNVFLSYEPAA